MTAALPGSRMGMWYLSCAILPSRKFLCSEDVSIFFPEEDTLLWKASASCPSSGDLCACKYPQDQWADNLPECCRSPARIWTVCSGTMPMSKNENVSMCVGACVCECVWVCEDVFQGDGQHVMVCLDLCQLKNVPHHVVLRGLSH